ncbi:MAG: Maf family protein [Planctomycetaceae bacterium]|jgi:septum formation protein|nr:Maf family protein [Planctomycetaceae bacterium]MBT6644036.1 Maf family protein [Planctomycetaceae bacterium]MBT6920759.1 Maf family protein [Planctomycetaceae bacterium]
MTLQSPLKLILASQSRRRRELATSAGWDVTITPPPEDAEASAPPLQQGETVPTFVTRLARAKAEAVSKLLPPSETRAILACDTVGEIGGVIFGKPTDAHDARRMIETLSGKKHRVFTGVSIWFPEPAERIKANTSLGQYRVKEGCAISEVFMELLQKKEVDDYLATNDWHGKAGACGFQDGHLPLRLITGSVDTVVGLPVEFIEQLVIKHLRSR